MAFQYLLEGYNGVLIYRGVVSEFPTDPIEGDIFRISGENWIFLDSTWNKLGLVNPDVYLTQDDINGVLQQLTDTLNKNGGELSDGEISDVMALVQSQIQEEEDITLSAVQKMISDALYSYVPPLDLATVQNMINDSVSSLTKTVFVDGVTITGDGTESNPLVAVGGTGGGIGEAPLDGVQYARKDGDWSEISIPGDLENTIAGIEDEITELDGRVTAVENMENAGFHPQDPVATYDDLVNLVSGFGEEEKNMIWLVNNDPNPEYNNKAFIWNGTKLVQITGVTDLSNYYTIPQVDSLLENLDIGIEETDPIYTNEKGNLVTKDDLQSALSGYINESEKDQFAIKDDVNSQISEIEDSLGEFITSESDPIYSGDKENIAMLNASMQTFTGMNTFSGFTTFKENIIANSILPEPPTDEYTASAVLGTIPNPFLSGSFRSIDIISPPSVDTDATNKKYVDDQISSSISSVSVEETDPVYSADKPNLATKDDLSSLSEQLDGIESSIGGFLTEETDPVYKADKPNIAMTNSSMQTFTGMNTFSGFTTFGSDIIVNSVIPEPPDSGSISSCVLGTTANPFLSGSFRNVDVISPPVTDVNATNKKYVDDKISSAMSSVSVEETDPVYLSEKPTLATKDDISSLSDQLDTLEGSISEFLTEETDPVYKADKENIAMTNSSMQTFTGMNTFSGFTTFKSSMLTSDILPNPPTSGNIQSAVIGTIANPFLSGSFRAIDIISPPSVDTDATNKQYVDSQISSAISNVSVEETDPVAMPVINEHKTTDRFRWQDIYNEEKKLYIEIAKAKGLVTDASNEIEVPAPTDPMVVNDLNGGILGITFTNTDTTYTDITLNSDLLYSSNGLTSGVPVTKYFLIVQGDTISATNATTFSYIPFTIDKSGTYAQITDMHNQMVEMQSTILSINARLAGKVLDPDVKIDIEAASQVGTTGDGTGYTIPSNNNLGGQITGGGIKALLAATGHVVITPADGGAVRDVYDNRGALGLEIGVDAMQPVDVWDGDIIESDGMDNLWYQPYKPGN